MDGDAGLDGGFGNGSVLDAGPAEKADLLVVDSAVNQLIMYRGERELGRFAVKVGRRGMGKDRRSDQRTPKGRYRLLRPVKSKELYFFLRVSYPDRGDVRLAKRRGYINDKVYDELMADLDSGRLPRQNSKVGGNVGIHAPQVEKGAPRPPRDGPQPPLQTTSGCIVMSDADLEALMERYDPGVTIELR